jgi:uncharacterized membrane protein YcaP (DUF421 family)
MDIVLRAAFIFLFVWLILRGMGKRELSQLNPFELVLLIVMGDLIQQAVTLEDHSVVGAVAIISTLALLTVLTSWISLRSGWFARLFEGEPAPVWKDGAPVERTMRRERIRSEELEAEARKQGIARLDHVHLATLEEDGSISFLRIERDGGEDADAPRGTEPSRPAL